MIKCECNLFANETILNAKSSSIHEAESHLQNDISNNKSSYMVLSTRHNVRDINITINDDSINVDNDAEYLD